MQVVHDAAKTTRLLSPTVEKDIVMTTEERGWSMSFAFTMTCDIADLHRCSESRLMNRITAWCQT